MKRLRDGLGCLLLLGSPVWIGVGVVLLAQSGVIATIEEFVSLPVLIIAGIIFAALYNMDDAQRTRWGTLRLLPVWAVIAFIAARVIWALISTFPAECQIKFVDC